MGGLGTMRSFLLEHLGFDNIREPIGAYDEAGATLSPVYSARRLALMVSASLRQPNGAAVVLQVPNGDQIPTPGSALPVMSYPQLYDPFTGNFGRQRGVYDVRGVSGVNASQQFVLDLLGLSQVLDILMVASAGTATLTVEVSVDNANWTTVDSIAAAASTVKHYNNSTVGATTALTPLAFRYVRITAGAAGVGNTTTLTVSAK